MRSLPSPRALALGLFVVLLAAFAVTKARSYLTYDRPVTSSVPIVRPTTPFRRVEVGAEPVCVAPVDFDPTADAAVVQVADVRDLPAGPPLELTARGPGYRASTRVAGGYAARDLLVVPFPPASRAVAGGELCLRSLGSSSAVLVGGAAGRELADERTVMDGEEAPVQLALALRDEPDRGLLARAGAVLDHAAFLRPLPFDGAGAWVLALLCALGVPVLVGVALSRALREDARP